MSDLKRFARTAAGVGAILVGTGWGCLSVQNQSTLDNPSAATGGSSSPFVEAYVEYPGPQSKWTGPSSFMLHVSAKDAGPAAITVAPELLKGEQQDDGPEILHRTPASAKRMMTSEEARSQLAHLANALQGAQAPFRGCMSPVRVRMVKADGGIFERQGCRSELGWSRAVSEAVSAFVDASYNGMTGASTVASAAVVTPAAAGAGTAATSATSEPARAPASSESRSEAH